jgi:exopolyphosphatase / guanosine-5'-triphosphate,3'-diphosphate pyrophosphatase
MAHANSVQALEPFAVVDIGSNSVRLVVYDGVVRSPTPIFNEKVSAGLGRIVASTGRLGEDAIERTLAAMGRFQAILRILNVTRVRALATAACREAVNGPEFLVKAGSLLGTRIEILSGGEEAELAAGGILMGFDSPDGFAGDLGGGSLEIIDIAGRKLVNAVSLPLGGLRLIDQTRGDLDDVALLADKALKDVSWMSRGHGRTFYAVGGSWRALAKLHMAETDYPLRVMQSYAVPAAEMLEFAERVRKSKKLSAFKGGGDIAKARREVLPYGAFVLERVIKAMKPQSVVFSVFGIREGLIYSLLPPGTKAEDPLIAFATEYARTRSRSLAHAHELIAWTDTLFGSEGLKEDAHERRLRHAACLISDISWQAHPDYRGEQSLNVIAHAALAGVDHPGRVFLAASVFFRHVGTGEGDVTQLADRLKAIAGPKLIKRARIIGAAVRAAHMLSIGRPGVINEVPLQMKSNALVLVLPQSLKALHGERLKRRFGALADLVEREPQIKVV